MAAHTAQALLAIVNQPQHRHEAQKFLTQCEEQDTAGSFPVQLLEIFANPQAAIAATTGGGNGGGNNQDAAVQQLRFLALTLCKNVVLRSWKRAHGPGMGSSLKSTGATDEVGFSVFIIRNTVLSSYTYELYTRSFTISIHHSYRMS